MSLATQIEEVMEPQIDNQLYDIPGFEGLYKITKDGRIYGIKRQYIVDVCNSKQKTTGEYIFKYMTGK